MTQRVLGTPVLPAASIRASLLVSIPLRRKYSALQVANRRSDGQWRRLLIPFSPISGAVQEDSALSQKSRRCGAEEAVNSSSERCCESRSSSLLLAGFDAGMWGVPVPQKLCGGEKDGEENIEMIRRFVKYACKSKSIKKTTTFVARAEVFDVNTVLLEVMLAKKLDRNDMVLVENITRCLETLRIIAVTHCCLEDLRAESFDVFNERHVAKLESFWHAMRGSPRSNAGIVGEEWMTLGFQGNDPTTDFRSMGMLALEQLVFFAKRKPDIAKLILDEFSQPGRTFPFAIIGVNLSRLVVQLFGQRRLHNFIIDRFGNLTVNCNLAYLEGPSNDPDCVEYCVSLVHEVYCLAFEEFYMVWVVRKPASIMDFTKLYDEVLTIMNEKFPPIV